MSQEKVNIKVEDVKKMLNNGKTREQIAEHYDIPMSAAKKTIFAHPDIKGLKTKKTYDYINVIDNEAEDTDVNVENKEPLDTNENTGEPLTADEPQHDSSEEQEEVPEKKVEWEE